MGDQQRQRNFFGWEDQNPITNESKFKYGDEDQAVYKPSSQNKVYDSFVICAIMCSVFLFFGIFGMMHPFCYLDSLKITSLNASIADPFNVSSSSYITATWDVKIYFDTRLMPFNLLLKNVSYGPIKISLFYDGYKISSGIVPAAPNQISEWEYNPDSIVIKVTHQAVDKFVAYHIADDWAHGVVDGFNIGVDGNVRTHFGYWAFFRKVYKMVDGTCP